MEPECALFQLSKELLACRNHSFFLLQGRLFECLELLDVLRLTVDHHGDLGVLLYEIVYDRSKAFQTLLLILALNYLDDEAHRVDAVSCHEIRLQVKHPLHEVLQLIVKFELNSLRDDTLIVVSIFVI